MARLPVFSRFAVFALGCCVMGWTDGWAGQVLAQTTRPVEATRDAAAAPARVLIRFLTTDDFPPFNSNDEDGVLTGLNVDLARALCVKIGVTCDIRVRPWKDLLPALERGEADAVIAAHRVRASLLRRVAFTDRYFHTPGRFAVNRKGGAFEATPSGLSGRRVAVVRGSAHEAFMTAFFRNTELVPFETPELARQALQSGKADGLFDDGIGLSFWVNGSSSRGCCALRGGPYFEPKFFGDGIGIAVMKSDRQLRALLNGGLRQVRDSGRLRELVDRYFPLRVY
ncbi:MAG TPA: transporter substrate-binding domain-containing protein [Hyphomicrobiaceae bacterium]|nr:transporter substrate-binding domain-containing protein [Hyphomicrobiaceae bacterium]